MTSSSLYSASAIAEHTMLIMHLWLCQIWKESLTLNHLLFKMCLAVDSVTSLPITDNTWQFQYHFYKWFWGPYCQKIKTKQTTTKKPLKYCHQSWSELSWFWVSLPANDLIRRPALNLDCVSFCQRGVSCFSSCWVRFCSTSSGKQCLAKRHFKRLQRSVEAGTKKSDQWWSTFWSASSGRNVWLQKGTTFKCFCSHNDVQK